MTTAVLELSVNTMACQNIETLYQSQVKEVTKQNDSEASIDALWLNALDEDLIEDEEELNELDCMIF